MLLTDDSISYARYAHRMGVTCQQQKEGPGFPPLFVLLLFWAHTRIFPDHQMPAPLGGGGGGGGGSGSTTSSGAQVNFVALAKCECSEYAVSDYVEAKWNDGQWFRATITSKSDRGKYDLSYDSGEDEAAVSAHLLRRPLARFGGKWPVFVVTRRDESRLLVEPLLLGAGGSRNHEWRPERSVRYLVSHERGAAFSSAKAAKKRKNRYSGIRRVENGWVAEGLDAKKTFDDEISAARARDWTVLEAGGGSELNFQDSLIWYAASKGKDSPLARDIDEEAGRKFLEAPLSKKRRSDSATLPIIGEALAECSADVLWQPVSSSSEATDVDSYVKDAALKYGGGEAAALLAYRRKAEPGVKNELTTSTPPVLSSSLPPALATSLWSSTGSFGGMGGRGANGATKRDKKKDVAYEAAISACKPKYRPRPTIVNGNRVLAGERAPRWEHLAQHMKDYPDWRLEPGLAPPVAETNLLPAEGCDPRLASARDAALEALRNLDEASRQAASAAWTYNAALSVFEDAKCCETIDAAAVETAKSLGALGAALFDLRHPRKTTAPSKTTPTPSKAADGIPASPLSKAADDPPAASGDEEAIPAASVEKIMAATERTAATPDEESAGAVGPSSEKKKDDPPSGSSSSSVDNLEE